MTNRRSGLSREGGGSGDRGRWSFRRKMEVVLRALRGEDLDFIPADLEEHVPPLAKPLAGLVHGPPDHEEAVVAPVEGGDRLEGGHVPGEVRDLAGRDVGKHGDDHVDRPPPGRRHGLEEVSFRDEDTIPSRAPGRNGIAFGTEDRGLRAAVEKHARYRAAAGAEIDRPAIGREQLRGPFRQRLALPPRDEHAGGHGHRTSAEDH